VQWVVLLVTLAMCAVAATLVVRHRRLVVRVESQQLELVARSRELATASDALLQTQEALARNVQLAAVGELAAMVAHEVRNPLAIISNAVAGLRKTEISREDEEILLDILQEETVRLENLVSDLLHYARPIRVVPVPIHMREVMDRVIARLGASIGCDVALEPAPDGDVVHGDGDLLRMVFDNLVDNAVQAMHGQGTVSVRMARGARDGVRGTTIDVVDTGDGMDTAVRHRAKDPFFTTRPTGTGLGLVIVERIVKAHGGHFGFTSSAGEGTTATVFLPDETPEATSGVLKPLVAPLPSSEELGG
jgi:signal transduction histidine kinase